MADLTVALDGRILSEYGAHSPVSMTLTHRGSGSLSWRMDPERHLELTHAVGSLVVASADGVPVWRGLLDEPAAGGEYHALGLPALADNTPALDGSSEPTSLVSTAITAALGRGALRGWKPLRFELGPWPGGDYTGATIADLLDAITAEQGRYWRIDGAGELRTYDAVPDVPRWQVTVPGYRYGYHTSELATHLYGYYQSGASPATFDATGIATGLSGVRREAWIDLRERGVITIGTAQALLRNIGRRQGRETPAPTERIEIPRGALQTPDGTRVPSWMATSGDTLRVWGATDGRSGTGYLDVVLAGLSYDDATGSAVAEPTSLAPRGYDTAMRAALSRRGRS